MRLVRSTCSLFALLGVATGLIAQSTVTTPEKFFGFQLGADRKMARWDRIVAYYAQLEKESGGKMKVINMGPTMNDNPFLMVIITSPKNMANLETIKKNNLTLVNPHEHPRGRDQEDRRHRQDRYGAVHEHARYRDRRHPDGARTRL